MTTATSGTGAITLGSALSGFQSFADAGVADGETIRYVIEDGSDWEVGEGVYTASGTTLTRTVLESSNSDAALNLSGDAIVYVSAAAEDIVKPGDSTELTNLSIKGNLTFDSASGLQYIYADSTSTNPVYTFVGDTDTGIAHPTAGSLLFNVNNTSYITLSSATPITFGKATTSTFSMTADSFIGSGASLTGVSKPGDNLSTFTNDSGFTTNTGTVDTSGTPVANDFARFTDANTIEGRSYAEVKTDLGISAFGESLIDDADASAARATLGLGTMATQATTSYLTATETETAIETTTINPQTFSSSGTYTLVLSDRGQTVVTNTAGSNTVQIPLNSSVAFATGSVITVIQRGIGQTTIAGATGVTVNGTSGGSVAISAQYQGVSLLKVDTDTWIVSGAI